MESKYVKFVWNLDLETGMLKENIFFNVGRNDKYILEDAKEHLSGIIENNSIWHIEWG